MGRERLELGLFEEVAHHWPSVGPSAMTAASPVQPSASVHESVAVYSVIVGALLVPGEKEMQQ